VDYLKFGRYTGFGTFKLEYDGNTWYFQSIAEVKLHFKMMVKEIAMNNIINRIPQMLQTIPTESGKLAADILTNSMYYVSDWKEKLVIQTKIFEMPKLKLVTKRANGTILRNSRVAHTSSPHKSYNQPDTRMINPNVFYDRQETSGVRHIYNRNDPLASLNYYHLIRKMLLDAVLEAWVEIVKKTYTVYHYIKVSKKSYGESQFLNPEIRQPKRFINLSKKGFDPFGSPMIDEKGSLLSLYNKSRVGLS
jgi:hypothetical protein